MSKLSPDYVFLGLLAYQSTHGYQLLEHFRSPHRLESVWDLSTSQLYNTLKRLESKHYIEGYDEVPADAPVRTVYHLTDTGKEEFELWLNDPQPSASTRAIRTEFLSRLYICRLLKRPTETIIEAQKHSCKIHCKELLERRDSLTMGAGYLSLDLKVREMNVITGWLEIAESMFGSLSRN